MTAKIEEKLDIFANKINVNHRGDCSAHKNMTLFCIHGRAEVTPCAKEHSRKETKRREMAEGMPIN